jgi:short-subunit dehydrogenase
LGLALAHELCRYGCELALVARDAAELEAAAAQLLSSGFRAAIFPCDITRQAELGSLVDQVLARFGRIDILVNDAGLIKVAPLDDVERADFDAAMDLMFWAPVNLTFAVLPHMKQQGAGHIINIASVGGRVSIPHLLPYSCAKFALVGSSTGLSAELDSDNIHVLTVVPGLMRTGSFLNAKFKGHSEDEFAWFTLLNLRLLFQRPRGKLSEDRKSLEESAKFWI